jgi:subtilase family serine protease
VTGRGRDAFGAGPGVSLLAGMGATASYGGGKAHRSAAGALAPLGHMKPSKVTRFRMAAAGMAAAGMLLAAGSLSPALASTAARRTTAGGTGDCDSITTCFTPAQLRVAYGIQPLIERGIDGRGETVVIPALAESQPNPPVVSDLREDMTGFDKTFGLPAPRMRVVTSLAGPGASPWLSFGEETLDAEMVHAIAPGAAITIVLLNQADLATPAASAAALTAMLKTSIKDGDVISVSAGWGEHCFTGAEVASMHAALREAARRHVTVVAGTGDIGAVSEPCDELDLVHGTTFPLVRGVSLPAADPLVLAAGGTTLDASHQSGAYAGETGWGLPYGTPGTSFQASGGGYSHRFGRPGYQDGLVTETARGVPDVSADANGHTGMALVLRTGSGGYAISDSGGTSAATPLWAAVIAVADQYAGHDLGFVNPALYRIASSARYRAAFHDVTKGNNTVKFPPRVFTGYRAASGWDPVTGLGSPDAQVLVPLLARHMAG